MVYSIFSKMCKKTNLNRRDYYTFKQSEETPVSKLDDLRKKVKENPNDSELHWNLGCALAYSGLWDEAWLELEWRMKGHRPSMLRRAAFFKPNWNGEQGKVLIYQDQGFGDLLMWIRYGLLIPNFVVEVSAELYRFMKFQKFNVVAKGLLIPEYDYVIPAGSLPCRFGTVYNPSPYLKLPESKKTTDKKRVGIAWAGSSGYKDDHLRSSTADDFARLIKDGREIVSLMVSDSDDRFEDYSLKLGDFHDTAELISGCDVIVSVDTAVAHLAAAAGKEVHLVLGHEHDWRWGRESSTTWYPTMKLWRQEKFGDWGILSRISEEIG